MPAFGGSGVPVVFQQGEDDREFQRSYVKTAPADIRRQLTQQRSDEVTRNVKNQDEGTLRLQEYLMTAEYEDRPPTPIREVMSREQFQGLVRNLKAVKGPEREALARQYADEVSKSHEATSAFTDDLTSDDEGSSVQPAAQKPRGLRRFFSWGRKGQEGPSASASQLSQQDQSSFGPGSVDHMSDRQSDHRSDLLHAGDDPTISDPSHPSLARRSHHGSHERHSSDSSVLSATSSTSDRRGHRHHRVYRFDDTCRSNMIFAYRQPWGCAQWCCATIALLFALILIFIFSYLLFTMYTMCMGGAGWLLTPAMIAAGAGGMGGANGTVPVAPGAGGVSMRELKKILADNNAQLLKEISSTVSKSACTYSTPKEFFADLRSSIEGILDGSASSGSDSKGGKAPAGVKDIEAVYARISSDIKTQLKENADLVAKSLSGMKGKKGESEGASELQALLKAIKDKLDSVARDVSAAALGGSSGDAKSSGGKKGETVVNLAALLSRIEELNARLSEDLRTEVAALLRGGAGSDASLSSKDVQKILDKLEKLLAVAPSKPADQLASETAKEVTKEVTKEVSKAVKNVKVVAGGPGSSGSSSGSSGSPGSASFGETGNLRLTLVDYAKPIFGTTVTSHSPAPERPLSDSLKAFLTGRGDRVRLALNEDLATGRCWPTTAEGYVEFAFRRPARITYLAVGHPADVKTPLGRDTAPKELTVVGYDSQGEAVPMGTVAFDKSGPEIQFLPLREATVSRVRVEFINHGAAYSCVYNLGLLGERAEDSEGGENPAKGV